MKERKKKCEGTCESESMSFSRSHLHHPQILPILHPSHPLLPDKLKTKQKPTPHHTTPHRYPFSSLSLSPSLTLSYHPRHRHRHRLRPPPHPHPHPHPSRHSPSPNPTHSSLPKPPTSQTKVVRNVSSTPSWLGWEENVEVELTAGCQCAGRQGFGKKVN